MGRLRQAQVKALGQEHECVQQPRRQMHVVVDDEQPVVAGGRMARQQRVEVLELPAVARGGGGEADLVAAAQQFHAGGGEDVGHPFALDADGQHPSPWPAPGRARQAPALQTRQRHRVADGVPGQRPSGGANAKHEAAGAREEIVRRRAHDCPASASRSLPGRGRRARSRWRSGAGPMCQQAARSSVRTSARRVRRRVLGTLLRRAPARVHKRRARPPDVESAALRRWSSPAAAT